MRFAILHCPAPLNPVWVPEDKLGQSGRCPDCGAAMQTPTDWPDFGLVEGPHIVRDLQEAAGTPAGKGRPIAPGRVDAR